MFGTQNCASWALAVPGSVVANLKHPKLIMLSSTSKQTPCSKITYHVSPCMSKEQTIAGSLTALNLSHNSDSKCHQPASTFRGCSQATGYCYCVDSHSCQCAQFNLGQSSISVVTCAQSCSKTVSVGSAGSAPQQQLHAQPATEQ